MLNTACTNKLTNEMVELIVTHNFFESKPIDIYSYHNFSYIVLKLNVEQFGTFV